ncbi:MAG TPA: radical SAM protein [Polyangiaceae bacterium]|nr:radical SAM protein [Polyangiaceae bacterium]
MRTVDVVVITSKLCNLRCKYCYELPLLSDKTRITLEQLEVALRNFDAFFRDVEVPTTIRFCWHGGEPLLIEPEYYWQAFELQKRVFAGSRHRIVNNLQTNLTVLDDARFDLMKNGFDAVGVSLDVVGGLRVNAAGKDQEHRTVANLDKVREKGLLPGGITVLSRANRSRLETVYRFYRDRGMSFRVLPVEPGLYEPGQSFELSANEILMSLCKLADLWFTETPALRIEPIHSFLDVLLGTAGNLDVRILPYDLTAWQWVVLLDTNGQILGYTDGFDGANSPGNIFESGFDDIMRGPAQARRARETRAQIDRSCTGCPYYGSRCSGHHVAEGGATMHEKQADGSLKCVVARGLYEHLERRLVEAGVLDAPGSLSAAFRQANNWPEGKTTVATTS